MVKGSIAWDDNNDAERKRPESVVVYLMKDGKYTGIQNEISSATNWKWFFKLSSLGDYDPGASYSVSQNSVPYYTTKITSRAAVGFIISNSLNAESHDWGEWETVTPATEESEGTEKRLCKNCGKVEIRAIPKVDPSKVSYRVTKGDEQIWYKGSDKTADFVFKRSVDDETTFSHFTGICVDGKKVAFNNYTTESGSVIVKLKPGYLNGLKLGKHTITAEFNDGSVEAGFKVAEAKSDDNKDKADDSGNNDGGKTSDNSSNGSGNGSISGGGPNTGYSNEKKTDDSGNNDGGKTSDNSSNGSGNGSRSGGSPNTGDSSDVFGWTFLFLASLLCLIATALRRRKRR